MLASNAAHLARLLENENYPGIEGGRWPHRGPLVGRHERADQAQACEVAMGGRA